ncbi:S-layer homology domain-containing protein, partial [Paenibacillus chartarius]
LIRSWMIATAFLCAFEIQDKKVLIVTAHAAEKIQGNADPTLTYDSSGLVGNDALTGGLARVAGEDAGVYPILSTLDKPNYNIKYTGNYLVIKSPVSGVPLTPTGGVSGRVEDYTGSNLPIIVSVALGNQVMNSQQTSPDGTFHFTELADGAYNVIANNGLFSESVLAIIIGGKITHLENIILGRIESIVEVAPSTPPVAVSGLHRLFSTNVYENTDYQHEVDNNGGRAQIIFAAAGKIESDVSEDANKIKTIANGQEIKTYIDFKVKKSLYDQFDRQIGQTEPLYELPRTIQIVLPLNDALAGKKLAVFRVHEGVPQQLSSDPTQPEYFTVSNTFITLNVNKFSTYAIGLANEVIEQQDDSTSSSGTTITSNNSIVGSDSKPPNNIAVNNNTGIAAEAFKVVSQVLNTDDHILYTVGYPDGEWKPNNNVTRAETAMMLYNLLRNKTAVGNMKLKDIEPGQWYYNAVTTLTKLSIISGYSDGTFKPNSPITRAEFVAMLERFANLGADGKQFSDVPSTHWAYNEIIRATGYGWIDGYPDHTFMPDKFIARSEAVTIINKMLRRAADPKFINNTSNNVRLFPDVSPDFWAFKDIVESTNSHDYTKIDTGETWTRLRSK